MNLNSAPFCDPSKVVRVMNVLRQGVGKICGVWSSFKGSYCDQRNIVRKEENTINVCLELANPCNTCTWYCCKCALSERTMDVSLRHVRFRTLCHACNARWPCPENTKRCPCNAQTLAESSRSNNYDNHFFFALMKESETHWLLAYWTRLFN